MSYTLEMPYQPILSTRDLAAFCRACREREELSQREAATKWSLNYVTIAKAETGKIEKPFDYLRSLKSNLNQAELDHLYTLLLEIDKKKLHS